MSLNKVIAIDGPAAAGKSTIAKMVAQRLGYVYVDTGAMYRALTLKAIRQGIDVMDGAVLAKLLDDTEILLTENKEVFLDGEDVTDAVRESVISQNVSAVAAHKGVREELKERQVKYAQTHNVVMDGRDIGTHVLPGADFKVFMTASVDVRAQRRYKENLERNIPSDLETLKDEIRRRDEFDSNREHAPLLKAKDAVEVDTSAMTIEEAVEAIINLTKGGKNK